MKFAKTYLFPQISKPTSDLKIEQKNRVQFSPQSGYRSASFFRYQNSILNIFRFFLSIRARVFYGSFRRSTTATGTGIAIRCRFSCGRDRRRRLKTTPSTTFRRRLFVLNAVRRTSKVCADGRTLWNALAAVNLSSIIHRPRDRDGPIIFSRHTQTHVLTIYASTRDLPFTALTRYNGAGPLNITGHAIPIIFSPSTRLVSEFRAESTT